MPATFWTLYHTFSDPAVLEDCREEVKKAIRERGGESYFDLAYIKSSCPLLVSTMQEAFRVHSVGMSARAVVENHFLDGKYLLKKYVTATFAFYFIILHFCFPYPILSRQGSDLSIPADIYTSMCRGSTFLIPSTVQHSSPTAWSQNVDEFYHKRFIKEPRTKHNPVAFRAFGGGATLCPGRHFASTEILAFASIILLRFNIKPVTGSWETDLYKETNAAFGFPIKISMWSLFRGIAGSGACSSQNPGSPWTFRRRIIPRLPRKHRNIAHFNLAFCARLCELHASLESTDRVAH